MRRFNSEIYLGCAVILIALVAIFVWLPSDSASGLIARQRGRVSIGEALAPAASFALMALAGGLILLEGRGKNWVAHISLENLRFLGLLVAIFAISTLLMRSGGPALVAIANGFGADELSYRELRDTAPWKYIGFVLGGTFLVASLMSFIEGRVSWRAIGVGLAAVTFLIAVFDLPFPDLLLPPNGDV
ncbi:hypothetical protein [Paracoccus albus]|uniref:hypothetical protein n=1 Tax=Paracoccus albus TaxID=3017784 RepID=UPI0022EFE1C6|nr:hypothetical protein [Paracoccus albus]WBU60566.1 hypothetical protein PAF20_01170 [Paracoccus albus]